MMEWLDGEDDEWEPCGCYYGLVLLLAVILIGTWVLAFYVSSLFTTGGQK